MKQHVSIESGEERIFGVLHQPDDSSSNPLVIFLHGWSDNKIGPQRSFVTAANTLVEEGYAVLRFDFRGSGDSDGVLGDQTITTMLKDLGAVIEEISSRDSIDGSRMALVGHSMGGFVSLLYAAGNDCIKPVILWMGRAYNLDEAHGAPWREEIERRGYYVKNGYKFTEKYYRDSLSYDTEEAMEKIDGAVGLIYGGFDEIVPPAEGEYVQSHVEGETKLEIVDTLDHFIQGEHNQEMVIDYTKDWLRKWL